MDISTSPQWCQAFVLTSALILSVLVSGGFFATVGLCVLVLSAPAHGPGSPFGSAASACASSQSGGLWDACIAVWRPGPPPASRPQACVSKQLLASCLLLCYIVSGSAWMCSPSVLLTSPWVSALL